MTRPRSSELQGTSTSLPVVGRAANLRSPPTRGLEGTYPTMARCVWWSDVASGKHREQRLAPAYRELRESRGGIAAGSPKLVEDYRAHKFGGRNHPEVVLE